MHLVPAGPRRRTRRAILASALTLSAAVLAIPAAADAATVRMVHSGAVHIASFEAGDGETNNLKIRLTAAGIVFDDQVPIRSLDSECRVDAFGDGVCPSATDISAFTHDRNDLIQYRAPLPGFVVGGDGADTFFGGIREAALGRQIEPVFYRGKTSVVRGDTPDFARDTISYALADRAVRVDLRDQGDGATSSDGRPGIDREQIEEDIEIVEGSSFDDTLIGSDRDEAFRGLNGDDQVSALGGDDVIDEGSAPNGADTLGGGTGANDRISYGTRTSGVNVSLDSVRNDGARTGEGDNVGGSVEHIFGSNFNDELTGNGQANTIDGFGGPDVINGLGGNDTLSAGASSNGVFGGIGNDVIFARNGQIDNIDCGENSNDFDTADHDTSENRVLGCERVQVGKLRLAPKAISAVAGKTTRLRLSWRHPVAWRKLRAVELRLTRDGLPVGEVTIRPRAGSISADGAVKLLRKRSRLTHKGKTVTARLAVRLDAIEAGETLTAEVEATDTRGARQLVRDAGTVRVAR